jgi:hypothetical protein
VKIVFRIFCFVPKRKMSTENIFYDQREKKVKNGKRFCHPLVFSLPLFFCVANTITIISTTITTSAVTLPPSLLSQCHHYHLSSPPPLPSSPLTPITTTPLQGHHNQEHNHSHPWGPQKYY